MTKKQQVLDYLKKNPKATLQGVADAVGCSVPTVSAAKKSAGIVRKSAGSVKKSAGKSRAKKSTPGAGDPISHIKVALEYVDDADALLECLAEVEKAGGVQAVKEQLHLYQKLSEVFG